MAVAVFTQRRDSLKPNRTTRPIRHRYVVFASVVSFVAASCGQSQTTANDTLPESSVVESTQQSVADSAPDHPTDSTDLGSVPTPRSDATPNPVPEAETQPAPATEPEPKVEPAGPSVLPSIAMTDVGAGNAFDISQLGEGQGDILLWFYLPT